MTTDEVAIVDLRAFCKSVELGSLSAAAKAMDLPKATVTRQLQRLESTLGQQLLNRGGGRFALTDEGRELARTAKEALRSIDDALARLITPTQAMRGRLRIAAPHTFGVTVIAPALPGFMQSHPDLNVSLDLSSRSVDLLADEADIAIRVGDPGNENLALRLLWRDRLLLCASPAYLVAAPVLNELADLASHRLLDFRSDAAASGFDAVDDLGQRQRIANARVVLRSNEPAVLAEAARESAGIALLPISFVEGDLAAGRLVQVLAQWQWPGRDINALYVPGRRQSQKIRAFLDYLLEYLGKRA